MKELAARLGVTVPFVALAWLLVRPPLWPPFWWWLLALLMGAAWAVSVGCLWLEYFEEQSTLREVVRQHKRLDRPARRPEVERPEEPPRPARAEPPPWPPPPDKQSF